MYIRVNVDEILKEKRNSLSYITMKKLRSKGISKKKKRLYHNILVIGEKEKPVLLLLCFISQNSKL